MQQTRREILDDFLKFVGEFGDVETRNIAERMLNRVLTSLWQQRRWRDYYSPAKFEITLVPGQRSYALPDYFGRMGEGQVMNLTRGTPLDVWTPKMLEENYPAAGTGFEVPAEPAIAVVGGVQMVFTQPDPDGELVRAISSHIDDVDIMVSMEGDDVFGRVFRARVQLQGTTEVDIGTFKYIDECGKSYLENVTPVTELTSSRGTVTFTTEAGTILQILYPQESAHEHKVLTFYPTPTQADVVAVPVMRRPKRLLYDADSIPADWENAVFEEMTIQWKLNTGEITLDTASAAPRPALFNLIALENSLDPPKRTRPFNLLRR